MKYPENNLTIEHSHINCATLDWETIAKYIVRERLNTEFQSRDVTNNSQAKMKYMRLTEQIIVQHWK